MSKPRSKQVLRLKGGSVWRVAASLAMGSAVVVLTGCGVVANPVGTALSADVAGIAGSVHGGQQPVAGALVTLMAPGLNGYGSAPTTLASAVTTRSGNFTLPAYTCPAGNASTYLYVAGGDAGSGTNAALAEAVLLGPCSSIGSRPFIAVSEATTVAAAYALAPFATVAPPTAVGLGAPRTNVQGLANAFGAASNLVDIGRGTTRAAAALPGMILPESEVNSLANILASCVNSAGNTGALTTCAALFRATTPAGGPAPTNTFEAALNIALHPSANVNTLFNLTPANAPFQPVLSTSPSDFTLAIGYNGGAIANSSGTTGVAIDALGNAWIGTGTSSLTVHSVTEISPAGVYLSGAAGYGAAALVGPADVALDQSGHVLVADADGNALLKFDATGNLLSTVSVSSFANPYGLAVDATGSSWVSNLNGTSVSHVSAAGAELAGSPVLTGASGVGLALSPSAVWVANFDVNFFTGSVTRIDPVSSVAQTVSFPDNPPNGVALDRAGNAWAAQAGSLAVLSDPGILTHTYPVDLFSNLNSVMVDGLNRTWASSFDGIYALPGRVIEMANDGTLLSPLNGFGASGVIPSMPTMQGGLAIDGSGNVWMTGYATDLSGTPTVGGNVVAEVIGAAAPVVTPLAVASQSGLLGQRP